MAPLIPNYREICKTLSVNESKIIELKVINDFFKQNIKRYQSVSDKVFVDYTGEDGTTFRVNFPIDLLCGIHEREMSRSWNGCLHNGDPLNRVTTHVPAGRGPFKTWEEAAIDALMMDKKNFPKEWTFEARLEFAERYNGLGYRKYGILSPYVFAGTNAYTKGMYVKDGVMDVNKVDRRLGVAAIMLELNRV